MGGDHLGLNVSKKPFKVLNNCLNKKNKLRLLQIHLRKQETLDLLWRSLGENLKNGKHRNKKVDRVVLWTTDYKKNSHSCIEKIM